MKVKDLVYIGLFTALIIVCSQISIPSTIPFTLQTLAIFLTAALLRNLRAFVSVLLYILLGIVGVPVFAGFKGGIGVLMSPTGGFILGFIVISVVMVVAFKLFGYNLITLLVSEAIGLLGCYVLGCVWFAEIYESGSSSFIDVVKICVIPFIAIDAIKIALATMIADRLLKIPSVRASLGFSDHKIKKRERTANEKL